jgi:hypothetical protein
MMIEVLKDRYADFVTPYDHADFYSLRIHDFPVQVMFIHGWHWRNVASSCMTFMTTRKTLMKTRGVFHLYSVTKVWDLALWAILTKYNIRNPRRMYRITKQQRYRYRAYLKAWRYSPIQTLFGKKYTLLAPIPAIATLMQISGIAPGVEWESMFQKYIA